MHWARYIARWGTRRLKNYEAREARALALGYTEVGNGAGRVVFLSPDKSHVVKLEYPGADFPFQNRQEAAHYKRWRALPLSQRKEGAQFAKCRLVKGIGIFMEAVDIVIHVEGFKNGKFRRTFHRNSKPKRLVKLPQWVFDDESLDGWQVGFTKDDKLVVYDYGVLG